MTAWSCASVSPHRLRPRSPGLPPRAISVQRWRPRRMIATRPGTSTPSRAAAALGDRTVGASLPLIVGSLLVKASIVSAVVVIVVLTAPALLAPRTLNALPMVVTDALV